MIPEKCSVCGGVVINGRCSECGMLYKDESKLYHLNESREEHYQHATREVKREIDSYSQNTKSTSGAQKMQGNPAWQQRKSIQNQPTAASRTVKRAGLIRVVPILIFIFIFFNIFSMIIAFNRSMSDKTGSWEEYQPVYPDISAIPTVPDFDWDMNVKEEVQIEDDRVMTDGGEDAAYTLMPGYYLVGAHIPEGTYSVEAMGDAAGEAVMSVKFSINECDGTKNQDYDLAADGNLFPKKLLGVKLFAGTIVEVQGNGQQGGVILLSDNAHMEEKQWQTVENPIDGARYFTDSITAGIDFDAGIYDIKALQGKGILEISGNEIDKTLFMSGADEMWKDSFQNFYFPEGTVITLQDSQTDFQFELNPSGEYYEDYSEAWTNLFCPGSVE